MKKIIRLTESDLTRIVKRVIKEEERRSILGMHNLNEQSQPVQSTPNTKYMAAGTKFCFFGSCRVDIKVIDKTTSQIITSKGSEGKDAAQIYPQVVKMVQDDLTSKKIVGVVIPQFNELQDTSPK